ncbi:MAG: hypothetical protein H6Q21_2374, partial [Bacteroidetes bacterium]|nr:hypothetical protein [Bacteroidota bacterium]
MNKPFRYKQSLLINAFFILLCVSPITIFTVNAQVPGDYRSNIPNVPFGTGDWTALATWQYYDGASWVAATSYPGQNAGTKTVTIRPTDRVLVNANIPNSIQFLVLSGVSPYNDNSAMARIAFSGDFTLNVSNDLTLNYSRIASLVPGSGFLHINGNCIVTANSGIRECKVTIEGTTTINATQSLLFDNDGTGAKIFKGIITNNGTWDNTNKASIEIQGGFENNGTFNSGTGTYSFTTNSQSIDGT